MSRNVAQSVIQAVLRDKTATQLVLLGSAISLVCFTLSKFLGSLTLLACIGASLLSIRLQTDNKAKLKVQNLIIAIVRLKIRQPDECDKVNQELDKAIESFFNRIINTFINSWYCTLTEDQQFTTNIKVELAEAINQIALRITQKVDHSKFLSNRVLPVVYSHIDILNRTLKQGEALSDQVQSFVINGNPVHPAAFSRKSELNYLRYLSKSLFQIVLSKQNSDSKILFNLLKEILACSVLLPLSDVISDPATINLLVIIATNKSDQRKAQADDKQKQVVLLENFVKQFQMRLYDDESDDEEQQIDRNFFKDQEKLYTFMQHLKSRGNSDIDLLKFYLDVEHLNSELEKSSVISDPIALSLLQQKSEKLLKFYQCQLFQEYNENKKPDDLLKLTRKQGKSWRRSGRVIFTKVPSISS